MLSFSERTILMSEPNKNNRTIKEIISDATDRELENFETGTMTPERLKELVAADDRKRKRRFHRLAGLAALFVVAVVGAVMVFNNFTTDVDADKNGKEEIITEDGVVIEDGGWGSSDEDDLTIADWNEVGAVKATIPELVVPEYIPEGYEFETLTIKGLENTVDIEYVFISFDEKTFIIHQCIYDEKLDVTNIYNTDRIINSRKGNVYVIDDVETKEAIIQLDDGIVVELWNDFYDSDIIKIVENLDF